MGAFVLMVWVLLLGGLAGAQEVPGLPSLDPSRLGADVFALGGVVLLVVQFVKRQVERSQKMRPWVWWATSITLAEAGAAGLFYARFGATFGDLPSPWGWLLFGLLAGLVASGFKDFVTGVVKGRPQTTAPPAAPLPAPDSGDLGPVATPASGTTITVTRPDSGLEALP